MNTVLRRLLASLLLVLGGLALASPVRAADAVITYQLPSPDTSGITAQVAPGLAGCATGCGTLRLVPGAGVPARRQGMLSFGAPAGTTIVQAAIRLRYRTKHPAISAHLQSRIGGRWIDGQRLRSAGGTTATVAAGRGATAVAVTLTADSAVPARAVRSDAENLIAVSSVQLTVRDLTPPSVSWATGDPASGAWQRGTLCGSFSARDAGLGIDRVEYQIGGVQAVAEAGPGTRLQPRPLAFDGSVCVDTRQLGDGAYGTTLTGVDSLSTGNRSAAVPGLVRVDNTAPAVEYTAPADSESRLPTAQLTLSDAASGVDRVSVTIDGVPAVLTKVGGAMAVRPANPLNDGMHAMVWEVVDGAGNSTTGNASFGVADVTAPTIDDVAPLGPTSTAAPVVVRASDLGAGLATEGWRLAIDGLDVTGAADVSTPGAITYAPARPWAEGEHVVRATAVDRSGNRTVRSWSFSIPTLPQPAPAPTPLVAPDPVGAATPEPAPAATQDQPARIAKATLSLRPSSRRVRAGAQLQLRGLLSGRTATHLRIEARVGRTWRLVTRVEVNATGGFSTPVRLPAPGTYDVRARSGALASAPVRLTAR